MLPPDTSPSSGSGPPDRPTTPRPTRVWRTPRPGEITLAHRGVLFLDELPEFGHNALESLRQPLEDHVVTISRAQWNVTFPCNFMPVRQ